MAAAVMAALSLALPPTLVLANDTAVGGVGGVVYPLAGTDIAMEGETVQVICCRDFAEYRIAFRFVNQGEPQTVQLGFPFVVTKSDFMGTAPLGFGVWQDGRPLAVTIGLGVSQEDLLGGDPGLGYYLHTAVFPSGETKIEVAYLAAPTVSAGSRFNEKAPEGFLTAGITGWAACYEYWLHTGAGWTGTIGKSVIRFQLADSFKGWAVDVPSTAEGAYPGNTTSPESYVKLDDRTYQWVFEDYEPTEAHDINFAFTRPNLYGSPGQSVPVSYGALGTVEDGSGGLTVTAERSDEGRTTQEWTRAVWRTAAPGKGGWVRFKIHGDQNLEEIRIVPGRNDTLTSFTECGRPRSLRVSLSDGSSTVITLDDQASLQRFAVPGQATWVRFDILDIYPGSRTNDTYISLVDFGNKPAPEFESFARLLGARTPSTMSPVLSTGVTAGGGPAAGVSGAGPTTGPTTAPTTGPTTAPTTGSTTGGATGRAGVPVEAGARAEAGEEDSEQPPWAVIGGALAAAIGLGVLIFIAVRLRTAANG